MDQILSIRLSKIRGLPLWKFRTIYLKKYFIIPFTYTIKGTFEFLTETEFKWLNDLEDLIEFRRYDQII